MRATQEAPLYFLHMLGFDNIPLTTDAIAEAASVDMVLVFDTSESMASDTLATLCEPFVTAGENCPFVDNYDAACNATNSCQPLLQAKDAANALLGTCMTATTGWGSSPSTPRRRSASILVRTTQ